MSSTAKKLIAITKKLATQVDQIKFGKPVSCVYNPLRYAWSAHEDYLKRYSNGAKEWILLGMNPGPFGMAQTGIPFGEVSSVRDWLGIETTVLQPTQVHPKRPITGFSCHRHEISGQRLWGWAKARFVTPEQFFKQFFVINYCPLFFIKNDGTNLTPDKLCAADRQQLFTFCDQALSEMVTVLAARGIVGVGNFAKTRAIAALANQQLKITTVPHPSPANPRANSGWSQLMDNCLLLA